MVRPLHVPRVALRHRVHRPPALAMRAAHELHVASLRAGNRQPNTISWHETVMDRYEAWAREALGLPPDKPLPLSALEAGRVRQFVTWLREGYESINPLTGKRRTVGAKTTLEYVRALKSLTRFLVGEEVIDRDPLANLKLPKVPKRVVPVFTETQIKLLISAIEHRPLRTRNLSLFYLLLATGARISEVLGLKWSDLDFKERRARVLGKGQQERWIYFDQPTSRLLMRLQAESGGPVGPVFLTKDRRPLRTNAVDLLFRSWGDEAGIVECHPHQLRHTFATTFLLLNPGQVLQLQERLGHADLGMVRRYVAFVEGVKPVAGPSIIEYLRLDRVSRYMSLVPAVVFSGLLILRRFDSILLPPSQRIG